jgi:uncharacterized protein
MSSAITAHSEEEDILVTQDVMVPMRDGIRLATDIYRPASSGHALETPLPVLLERTPYGKAGVNHADRSRANPNPLSKPQIAAAFARAGYVVAVQDCRGRHNSEGLFTKYVSEGADGFDTIAWLCAQPWCSGKIGTYGLSYGAHVQAALASLAPRGLAAMFLDSGGFSSAYHSGIRQGGTFELKQATWAYRHALLSPETARDPARKRALESEDLKDWFRRMPWSKGNSPLRAAPEYEDYLFEQWHHGTFGPYWERPGLYARGYYDVFPDVPTLHMSSWYDPYARTATENFLGTAHTKRGPIKLILGPWTHGQRSVTHAGDVDFGPEATLDGNVAPDYIALRLAWFDRHLKGTSAPDYLPKPVKVFVMGGGPGDKTAEGRLRHGGRWCDEESWPPADVVPTPFYLHDSGALSTEESVRADAAREFVFDPADPVPTIGGAFASGAPIMEAGAYDQRETAATYGAREPYGPLSARADVLVFQSEPLAEDMEVVGPITAELWVSSSAPDTDITLKLIDCYPPSRDWPDGFAMNLTHGILRLRYRDSFSKPSLLEPGRAYKIVVEAFPTANLFARGHRIRLDVSSSNFPHFDVNPNSGEPEGSAAHRQIARNRLFMDHTHRSHVLLPVKQRR